MERSLVRYRLVDALRALAAGLVLLTHVAFWTGASQLDTVGGLLARADSGVAMFFAISAFLLLPPWLRRGLGEDVAGSPGRYALRRAARILPAYWLALAAVLAVAAAWPGRTGGVGGPWVVLRHAALLQGYSAGGYQAFSQTWSLTTEVTFYLLIPWLGTALGRLARTGPGRVYAVLLGTVAVGLAAQGVAAAPSASGPGGWRGVLATSVLGHAAWFAAGAAVAVARTGIRPRLPVAARQRCALLLASPATLVALAATAYLVASTPLAGPTGLQPPSPAAAVLKEGLYTLIAAALVLAATAPEVRGPAASVAAHPVVRWLADVSYPVFLWHVLVLQLIYLTTGFRLFSGGFGWVLLATVVISLMLGQASFAVLERPVLTWVHRRTRVPARSV